MFSSSKERDELLEAMVESSKDNTIPDLPQVTYRPVLANYYIKIIYLKIKLKVLLNTKKSNLKKLKNK